MKIGIIIVNWNNFTDTQECLKSLEKVTYPDFFTVVVDNGSNDQSGEKLKKQFPSCHFIYSLTNLGFTGGNNLGIEEALKLAPEALLLLNNDTIVSPDFLDEFVAMHKNYPKHLLGGKILCYQNPTQFDHLGGNWNHSTYEIELFAKNAPIDKPLYQKPLKLDYVMGCGLFIPKKLFDQIGFLDDRFFLLWEDTDYCMRAKTLGFGSIYCPKVVIHHKGSQSFAKGSVLTSYYFWRNKILWMEKHIYNTSPTAIKQYTNKIIRRFRKHYFLIKWHLLFTKKNEKSYLQKQQKLQTLKAALKGLRDAKRGNYGKGPKWVSK